MPQLAGTSNVDALAAAANVTISGNLSVSGSTAFTGAVTNTSGGILPGTLYAAAGTVTLTSGYVVFNASVAGYAVRLPAPQAGAEFRVINQIVASSGSNTITIPAGGTIYQGATNGSVLTFGTLGQTATLLGLNATQYRVISNLGSPVLS